MVIGNRERGFSAWITVSLLFVRITSMSVLYLGVILVGSFISWYRFSLFNICSSLFLFGLVQTLISSMCGLTAAHFWGSWTYNIEWFSSYVSQYWYLKVGVDLFWWHFRVSSLLLRLCSPKSIVLFSCLGFSCWLSPIQLLERPVCSVASIVLIRFLHLWTIDSAFNRVRPTRSGGCGCSSLWVGFPGMQSIQICLRSCMKWSA